MAAPPVGPHTRVSFLALADLGQAEEDGSMEEEEEMGPSLNTTRTCIYIHYYYSIIEECCFEEVVCVCVCVCEEGCRADGKSNEWERGGHNTKTAAASGGQLCVAVLLLSTQTQTHT